MKKNVMIAFCLILCSIVSAQRVKYNLLDHIAGSVGFKGPPISNDNINTIHIIDWSLGYKFKSRLSVGVNMADCYFLNYSNHSYKNNALFGLNVKYPLFDFEIKKVKTLGLEPYLIFFPDIHSGNFTCYDAGVNFVVPSVYYCFVGTGAMLNVYNDGNKPFWGWYFSFGLRR